MSGDGWVFLFPVERLRGYSTDSLGDVEDIIGELLGYHSAILPDDLGAKLASFRDDIRQALADREGKTPRKADDNPSANGPALRG
jgi:hypothetical protein